MLSIAIEPHAFVGCMFVTASSLVLWPLLVADRNVMRVRSELCTGPGPCAQLDGRSERDAHTRFTLSPNVWRWSTLERKVASDGNVFAPRSCLEDMACRQHRAQTHRPNPRPEPNAQAQSEAFLPGFEAQDSGLGFGRLTGYPVFEARDRGPDRKLRQRGARNTRRSRQWGLARVRESWPTFVLV